MKATDQCLNLEGYSRRNGAGINRWSCNGHASQKWVKSGKQIKLAKDKTWCLNLHGNVQRNGATVNLWKCNTSPSQHWIPPPGVSINGPCLNNCQNLPGTGATILEAGTKQVMGGMASQFKERTTALKAANQELRKAVDASKKDAKYERYWEKEKQHKTTHFAEKAVKHVKAEVVRAQKNEITEKIGWRSTSAWKVNQGGSEAAFRIWQAHQAYNHIKFDLTKCGDTCLSQYRNKGHHDYWLNCCCRCTGITTQDACLKLRIRGSASAECSAHAKKRRQDRDHYKGILPLH